VPSSTQLNADQAALTAARNQLTNAQNSLGDATLTAPMNGTVAAVNLTVGQQVSGGSSPSGTSNGAASSGAGSSSGTSSSSAGTGSGQSAGGQSSGQGGGGQSGGQTSGGSSGSSTSGSNAQLVVISDGSPIVNVSVDDTQVGQVKVGDQAMITPSGSTTPVYGTVTSVGMLASSSSSVPIYPVTISVTGTPGGLFPGAGAQVSITVKQVTDALVVPAAAVHYTNGQATVAVLTNGRQTSIPVNVGMTSGGQTQILSGVSEGDQVVVPGAPRANQGTTGGLTGGRGGFGGFRAGG
jgi:macrolide-specific efflux system membrane fusion protein